MQINCKIMLLENRKLVHKHHQEEPKEKMLKKC